MQQRPEGPDQSALAQPAAPAPSRRTAIPSAVLAKLPFVGLELDGSQVWVNFWAVEVSGDGQADFARGRQHAVDLISVMQTHNFPALFLQVVQALFDSNRWTAVEAGFFSIVGLNLARPAA
jgi:hypothetical protein